MKDIFEPASWKPNQHIVIKDETLQEASYTGLDLNWSSNSSDIRALLTGYTLAFDSDVYDLTDVYSSLQSYESLRVNLKGTALADFINIGGMANQEDFKSYWFLGAGDDIIKADDAARLTLLLRDGFENFASGSSEWLSEISYDAFWDTDHYKIAVSQDGNLLGTTTTYGPLTDIDISADTTIVLSDRGEDIEYVSGRADVTLGEGTDLIQLSFEEQSTSSDQLIIKDFSNTDSFQVSYDPDANNAVDIMQEYSLSEIVDITHNIENSQTYINFQTPYGLIENYIVFDSLVYVSALYSTDQNEFVIRLSDSENDSYFSDPSWLGTNTGAILAEWMEQFSSELAQFGIDENFVIKQSPDGSGVILDQLNNVVASLEAVVGHYTDSTGVYWYINAHTQNGQFFQINGVNEYDQETGEYSVPSKGIALRANYTIDDDKFNDLIQEFWPTIEFGQSIVATDITDIARIDHFEWYRDWLTDGNLSYEPEAHFVLADENGNPNWENANRFQVILKDDVKYIYNSDWNRIATIGSESDNFLYGTNSQDTIYGMGGDDHLMGHNDDDELHGGAGNDTLDAGSGDDKLYGGAGDDILIHSGSGAQLFDGGDGIDTYKKSAVEAGLNLNIEVNLASGYTGSITDRDHPLQDTVVNIENIDFSLVDWELSLIGDDADNILIAGGGNDTLNGGAGDDTLSGGSGSDKFIFDVGFGNDIITDFTHGLDELKFYDANGELLSSTDISETQNEDGDAVLTVSDGSSVTLSGVSVYSLPFNIVSQKSGDYVTVNFYLDPNQDPGDTGVGSFNATLGFDPNSLTYVSSSFADGLTGIPNATDVSSGTLGLGGFGLTPVTDLETALFSVTFEANAVTEPVQLTLSEVEVDATSLSGGTYTTDLAGATLSGSVVTRSGAALSDVLLETDTGLSTQTSSAGAFEMDLTGSEQLLSGSLSFSNTGSTKAISAADALDALKLSVGLPTDAGVSDAFSLISADFDQNGKVTASDALEILKYSVGLPTEQNAQWVFLDTNADYSNVNRSTTNYTEGVSLADITSDATIGLTGILIGDVNDSYSGLIA